MHYQNADMVQVINKSNKDGNMNITNIINSNLKRNKIRLEMAENRKDYEACIETRGRILELKLLLKEVEFTIPAGEGGEE